ncbi:relaxin receptor 2-like isoform X2 [Lineus longissimus]|uniref:relaxin receptor 2-like isoform X2 n=1 Tax=Lineus longissimus TaxID=88925 RepID=UPI002B4DAD80
MRRTRMFAILSFGLALLTVEPIKTQDADGNCPLGYFPCGNLTQCVAQQFQCDGNNDCPNSADEDYYHCQDSEGWFEQFIIGPGINKNVSDSWNTSKCDLKFYPPECKCRSATRLDCGGAGFTTVPQNISTNIARLFLQNNMIKELPVGAFSKFTKLDLLHLENNSLEIIHPGSFSGLGHLLKLFLNSNKLERLKPGIFRELNSLYWLFVMESKTKYVERGAFEGLDRVNWIDFRNNEIADLTDGMFEGAENAVHWIDLENNTISRLHQAPLKNLHNLTMINLLSNRISEVEEDTFFINKNLLDIDLSDNLIQEIHPKTFSRNHRLEKLSLGCNPIKYIPITAFQQLGELTSLNLSGITIRNLHTDMFLNNTKLHYIYFSDFAYCSYAPHVARCEPKSDGISSTENLLEQAAHRGLIWLVAIITCFCNIFVFIGRMLSRGDNIAHSLCVKNLCASDFLMGVYLVIIASHDIAFRGIYNMKARYWMTSVTCKIAGILGMVSSEVSVLILMYMSLERFMKIANPYANFCMSNKPAIAILIIIWIFGFALALVPLSSEDIFGNFYGSNGMCFPIHIHDPFMTGWEYSAFIFLGLNFSAMVTIIVCYAGMFVTITKTRNRTNTTLAREMSFAKRFLLIVLSDCFCWFPIIIIKVIALSGIPIPAQLYAWVSIFILPINSALNPVLYSFSTVYFRSNMGKIGRRLFGYKKGGNGKYRGFHMHSVTDGDQTTSFTVCKTEIPNGNDITMDDIKREEESQKMVEIPLKECQYN